MPPILILVVILAVAAIIALAAFVIYRILRPRLKEEKPSEEQIVQEEINRVLQDIEDEETKKEIINYKQDD
ncbi:MAG: hypothetical protein GXY27_01745 [Erysipelotrichaceae bacterium]|jgi:membrane protein implicated in regulation of membrane protease activity|nr:hypothetical protein [Erysipelotrichaceae bacterium]